MNIKKILYPVVIGIITAFILLLFFPVISNKHFSTTPLTKSIDENTPISYYHAVRKAAPAVVNIYNRSNSDSLRLGSGVIMNQNGYILTSHHVVINAEKIIVALQDGRLFQATIIGSDPLVDLSVLKIDGKNLPSIIINPNRVPRVGDIVLAIGNPFNIGQTITQGIISATGRDGLSPYRRQNFIQTDASINSGNSGGALINTVGELIGINTISINKNVNNEIPEGISFAIPTALATKVMNKLIQYGKVIRGYIGIDGVEYIPQHFEGKPSIQGILVKNAEGPAKDAGIEPNDIIISVNNIPVKSIVTTMDQITEIEPNTKVPIQIIRNNKKMVLTIVIGTHPSY